MDRPVRIAVVGPVDERLVGDLRTLPLQPEVRPCTSLCADSEALARFQPDLLLMALGADSAEELGALRLLHQLWPAMGVVLVTDAKSELANTPIARRLAAQLLVYPDTPGQLAAVIEQALLGSDRPRADVFVDLAHGIADEINNPLLFVSGHLQLLRASLQSAEERHRRDQIAAALAGVQRIQTSVDRLRMLSQAANGPKRREVVDLADLLGKAIAARTATGPDLASVAIAAGAHEVPGDREQLTAAVASTLRFADDTAALGSTSHLQLDGLPGGRRLRLTVAGPGLVAWHLPHSFEPYYPNRALRGQGYGLGLFVAQTVVLGHRGQATVRRQPDGSLQFDFVLPA